MAGATVRAKSTTNEVWVSSHHRELLSVLSAEYRCQWELTQVGYGAGRATAYGRLEKNKNGEK